MKILRGDRVSAHDVELGALLDVDVPEHVGLGQGCGLLLGQDQEGVEFADRLLPLDPVG